MSVTFGLSRTSNEDESGWVKQKEFAERVFGGGHIGGPSGDRRLAYIKMSQYQLSSNLMEKYCGIGMFNPLCYSLRMLVLTARLTLMSSALACGISPSSPS